MAWWHLQQGCVPESLEGVGGSGRLLWESEIPRILQWDKGGDLVDTFTSQEGARLIKLLHPPYGLILNIHPFPGWIHIARSS